ncbi:AAC(3) family N-acetyltransferase [Polyangium sp. y55x31]|uniref:aminoglycoside N(3)-acetyltransferase n=1 Tax=Polyangium sp. y55x31 TaxID=3042688 RepID=UPI002482B463|nr:AAC(3) family N-acetyltransferase [Polyangium sp. y55x31]MDI1475331.1 AAC(3) family N-acetyltransferase [Polyangium sp. y55x31]
MSTTPPPQSPTDLVRDLRQLGVRAGDTLMIHASLRAVGPVEGGARGVLDALDDAVGEAGTLMMVLGARDDWAWVNDLPEHERAAHLENAEPFDSLRTPADPDVGYLAEALRQRPGTLVSDHPEGRFGARGARAVELLRDPPWHDYFGPGSPLEKLCQLGGRVLRLGADFNTTTVLHWAEYLVDLPDKRRVRRYRRIAGSSAPEIRHVDCLDDSDGIVEWDGEDYFAVILQEYLATGCARQGTVGRARSELLEAADLVRFGVAWMNSQFARQASLRRI